MIEVDRRNQGTKPQLAGRPWHLVAAPLQTYLDRVDGVMTATNSALASMRLREAPSGALVPSGSGDAFVGQWAFLLIGA